MAAEGRTPADYADRRWSRPIHAGDIVPAVVVEVGSVSGAAAAAFGFPPAAYALEGSVAARDHIGGTAPRRVRQEAAAARAREAEEQAHELEVVPYLRQLGYNARDAREASTLCRDMRDASLEQRGRSGAYLNIFQK